MMDHEPDDRTRSAPVPDPSAPGHPGEEGAEGRGADGPSLEERLRRLDAIVSRLEGGEVELEEGLALFEEGVRHVRQAEALLARAELRVEELVGEGDQARTRDFPEGGNGGAG